MESLCSSIASERLGSETVDEKLQYYLQNDTKTLRDKGRARFSSIKIMLCDQSFSD